MRVLTFLLILTVIVLISNASPPKKRGPKSAVVSKKRPFKRQTPARPNSAASGALSGSKSARNSQFKKATGTNKSRTLQNRSGSGSSNNGKAQRAAGAKSPVGSQKSRAKLVNKKRPVPALENRKRTVKMPPFPEIPDDILLDDDEDLDEFPDNDIPFTMPKNDKPIVNKPRGQKTSSKKSSGGSNDELFDDDFNGNSNEKYDFSDIAGKSIDELLNELNLDNDDKEIGDKPNADGSDSKKFSLEDEKNVGNVNDAQHSEMLKSVGIELDRVVDDEQKESVTVAQTEAEPSSVDKNVDKNDEKKGVHSDVPTTDDDSERVEKPIGEKSGESSSIQTQPTGTVANKKDDNSEDLNEEDLPEDDIEEDYEDDDAEF